MEKNGYTQADFSKHNGVLTVRLPDERDITIEIPRHIKVLDVLSKLASSVSKKSRNKYDNAYKVKLEIQKYRCPYWYKETITLHVSKGEKSFFIAHNGDMKFTVFSSKNGLCGNTYKTKYVTSAIPKDEEGDDENHEYNQENQFLTPSLLNSSDIY